jgi:SP family sugar:H+ symporter-like MFS transporter
MLGSWVSSHWGRRMCMFSMSIWACVAATIVITSKTRDQILVGRVMNYIYIGMELSVVPIFQGEIVPAQARGFVVGTYQISLFIGGLIMSCVARGTGGFAGREAYMIPFGLFYIVPTIVACLIWFVPESPRSFLVSILRLNKAPSWIFSAPGLSNVQSSLSVPTSSYKQLARYSHQSTELCS